MNPTDGVTPNNTHCDQEGSRDIKAKTRQKPFLVDRSRIPTVHRDDQNGELYNLGVSIYEQSVLEEQILEQVDETFETQHQERVENIIFSKNENFDRDKTEANNLNVNVEIDSGENSPKYLQTFNENDNVTFDLDASKKCTTGNNLSAIEKYLADQVKAEENFKILKGKLSGNSDGTRGKKTNSAQLGNATIHTKRKKRKIVDTNRDNISDSYENACEHKRGDASPLTEVSGSEYCPSESDYSDDNGGGGKWRNVPKGKKRNLLDARRCPQKSDGDWCTDDSDWEYSDDEKKCKRKSKSVRKEADDGNLDIYIRRLSEWERVNNREDIEAQVKTIGDGFKVPLIIWNKLFNYQKVGVQWLWELNVQRCGGILGDEMGLGKTIQVIAFLVGLSVSKLVSRHGSFRGLGPVLIVCPTTVMHQWIKELHSWWPQFRVSLMHDSGNYVGKRSNLLGEIVKCGGILVTSFVNCVQQINLLTTCAWHYVILDEGHKIRNPDSQIANAVKQLRTPHRLILSGSPMQNNLKELWSLFDFIFPGKLGTLPVFLSEFAVPITQGGYANASQVQVTTAYKCATVLRDTIAPYLLRRVKEDVKNHINLPMKNEQVLFCKLTEEQRNLYKDYLASGEVNSILSGRYKVFVGLINLRKICNHPHLYSGGPKIFKWENIESIPAEERYGYWKKAGKMIVVETLLKIWKKQDHRVIIFTQSKQMLHILECFVQLQGYTFLKLDGSTSIGSRQPIIRKFNEDKQYFIFLSTTHVGGLGINLTGADRVIIYDPDWNPATDTQARERAWRIGQLNQVTIYRLVTSGTIEEKIYHRQIFKQFLTNRVLKDPKQRRFFKSNDLYELFTLREETDGTTETSAIFAGSGSEVSLKTVSSRLKKRMKHKLPECEMGKNYDFSKLWTPEKVEEMKKLAKLLSQNIGRGITSMPGEENGKVLQLDLASAEKGKSQELADKNKPHSASPRSKTKRSHKRRNSKEDQLNRRRKSKSKLVSFATFEGETVPYLVGKSELQLASNVSNNGKEEEDDYILKKLFSKSGIQNALQHDRIMEGGPADYALVEGEAERTAKEAVRALKKSRQEYFNRNSGAIVDRKPRFGYKNKNRNSGNDDRKADVCQMKTMKSSELLNRIKERNLLLRNPPHLPCDTSSEHLELLTDIRNFVALDATGDNTATTQGIIDSYLKIMNYDKDEEDDSLTGSSEGADYDENGIYLKGPPFNPVDYMISPSDSDVIRDEESDIVPRRKLRPSDLKLELFALDARKALKKLQDLVRDKFGKNLIKRQRHLVRIVVKGMPFGFLLEDIAPVIEIMEYFSFNCKSVPEYVGMINMMLQIAVHPPRISKGSEVLNCKKDLSNYFTMLGELLVIFDDHCIQFRVLEILNILLVRRQPADVTCIRLLHCYSAMEESLLPYTIATLLETVSDKLYCHYLEIALQIVLVSRKACIVMIQSGAIEFVLWRLDPYYSLRQKHIAPLDSPQLEEENDSKENNNILDSAGHLLWNLLSVASDIDSCKSPSQNALWSLRYALHAESKKRSKKSISTRNNLAGIVVKLLVVFGDKLPVVQSGLAVDIAMLSVATEIGTENTWAENITFGASKEDYILKKLMMICCCELAKNDNAAQILREQKVIEGVLHLINPGLTSLSVSWMPSQFLHLLLLALPVLSDLVPVLPDVYVTNKGNTRILMALEWFMEEHFDRNPLLETLKTLCTLVTCENNSGIIEDLKEQHGVKTLLNICFYILESHSLKQEHQEKLTRIFVILERLCRNEVKIQACLGNMYVAVSIKFLRRVVKNYEEDSVLDPRLLICFSSFLWEAVAWCPVLLKSFTEQTGIYLILDLIEMSSYPVPIILIGLLVDMADEGETLTHLLTWRDRNGYGLLNKMIEIWREEELIYRVPRTSSGCIADVERPLMSEEQWYITNFVKNDKVFSPAIAEMICNVRPKIHSIYQLLRQRYGEMTNLNESLYSIHFDVVTPQNQVYIPVIEHFLALKLGEIWYEVYHDVIAKGLIPSSFDGEMLSTLLEQKNKWACRLKTVQEEIIAFQKLNSSEGEGKLYNLIRSCCLASTLDALHELEYITRTSCKEIQISKRSHQLKNIDNSLGIPLEDDSHIHRTVVRNCNVTFMCGKYVWFKSEKEATLEKNIIRPVSSDSSECNEFVD